MGQNKVGNLLIVLFSFSDWNLREIHEISTFMFVQSLDLKVEVTVSLRERTRTWNKDITYTGLSIMWNGKYPEEGLTVQDWQKLNIIFLQCGRTNPLWSYCSLHLYSFKCFLWSHHFFRHQQITTYCN